jgi:hypothetical protein
MRAYLQRRSQCAHALHRRVDGCGRLALLLLLMLLLLLLLGCCQGSAAWGVWLSRPLLVLQHQQRSSQLLHQALPGWQPGRGDCLGQGNVLACGGTLRWQQQLQGRHGNLQPPGQPAQHASGSLSCCCRALPLCGRTLRCWQHKRRRWRQAAAHARSGSASGGCPQLQEARGREAITARSGAVTKHTAQQHAGRVWRWGVLQWAEQPQSATACPSCSRC